MPNKKTTLFITATEETGSLFSRDQITDGSSTGSIITMLQFEGFLLKNGTVTTGGCTSKLNRHDEFTESESESILSIFTKTSGPKLDIFYLPSKGAYRLICKEMRLDLVDKIIIKVECKSVRLIEELPHSV